MTHSDPRCSESHGSQWEIPLPHPAICSSTYLYKTFHLHAKDRKSTIPFLIISNDSLPLLKVCTLEFVINWFLSLYVVNTYCLENVLLCLEYENSPIKSLLHYRCKDYFQQWTFYSTKFELKLKALESNRIVPVKKVNYVLSNIFVENIHRNHVFIIINTWLCIGSWQIHTERSNHQRARNSSWNQPII